MDELTAGTGNVTRAQFLRLGLAAVGACLMPAPGWAQEAGAQPLQGDSLDAIRHGGEASDVPFLMRGTRQTRKVALTYDDGPCPLTDKVLDSLAEHNAKATFFCIGNKMRGGAAHARRALKEGHEIANHSYTHPALGKMSPGAVMTELSDCQKAIEDTLGNSPRWFRPPYGSFRSPQATIAKDNKVNVVLWSVDPEDWRRPGVSVVQDRVLKNSNGGSIILLHDIHPPTIDATPGILKGLIDQGFELVTLSELILGSA